MSVTQQQFDRIARNRRVYFNSADGRAALRESLESFGLFVETDRLKRMAENPAVSLRMLTEAVLLLKDLGVLVEDNYDRLIEAMAGLPMPQIQEHT